MLSGALVFVGLAYVAYLFWFSLVLWQAKDATKWLFGAKKVSVPQWAQWVRPTIMPLGLPAPA